MGIRVLFSLVIWGMFCLSSCDQSETTSSRSGDAKQPVANTDSKPDGAPERIAVGDKAPGFRLNDQSGTEHTLQSLLAKGKVALVFYRSAEW